MISADWYRRDGSHKSDIDWVNHEHHCFALHIIGEVDVNDKLCKQEWLFCINSLDADREFNIDVLLNGKSWTCVLDTAIENTDDYNKKPITALFSMNARSMRVYKS